MSDKRGESTHSQLHVVWFVVFGGENTSLDVQHWCWLATFIRLNLFTLVELFRTNSSVSSLSLTHTFQDIGEEQGCFHYKQYNHLSNLNQGLARDSIWVLQYITLLLRYSEDVSDCTHCSKRSLTQQIHCDDQKQFLFESRKMLLPRRSNAKSSSGDNRNFESQSNS